MNNSSQKGHLLIVTGSTDKDRLQSAIEPLEIETDWASSAKEARDLLGKGGNGYGAVIVDEDLPEDGWRDVTKFARSNDVSVPFLVCTSEVGGKKLLAESQKTFISDVLVRPFDKELVRERVQAALKSDREKPLKGAARPSHPLE